MTVASRKLQETPMAPYTSLLQGMSREEKKIVIMFLTESLAENKEEGARPILSKEERKSQTPALLIDHDAIHLSVFAIDKVVLVAQMDQYVIESLFLEGESQFSEALSVSLHSFENVQSLFGSHLDNDLCRLFLRDSGRECRCSQLSTHTPCQDISCWHG